MWYFSPTPAAVLYKSLLLGLQDDLVKLAQPSPNAIERSKPVKSTQRRITEES